MNGSWNRPTVIPRQPSFLEQITPSLLNFGAQLGLMKMGQNWQTKQTAAAAVRAGKIEESRRQFETLLKGAKYDAEKGTLTFEPLELTEDQKKRFDVIQPPGRPAQIFKKLQPVQPKFFTSETGEVTPVTTSLEGPQIGPSLGRIGKPSPKPTALTLQQQTKLATHKEGLKGPRRDLKALSSRYQAQIGRYYSAKRGVGQFIADPNKEQVATEALKSAETIAVEYVKAGGKPEALGITAQGIKADFEAGKISKKKAIYLLQNLFGMK